MLARGCMASVPKEGPSGALNTRPLTVPYVVYRLWAGVCLQEMLEQQERWVHPVAFGFKPVRSGRWGCSDPASARA